MSEILDKLTVKELSSYDKTRAEDMDLRHKDCGGGVDLKVGEDKTGKYWLLQCSRCHVETVVPIGRDTKAIAMTATDGEMRTLSGGQTIEQVRPQQSRGFG